MLGGQNDYYCDANKVGGTFCPEFDIMEANQFSWQTTAHKCDAPTDKGHYWGCDGGGNDLKNFGWYDGYGPTANKIDTTRKFSVKIDFTREGSTLKGYTITHTQDGRSIQFGGYNGYSQALSGDMDGHMAYAFSLWGPGGTDWLDGGRCQRESSCGSSSWEITNLRFTTSSSTANTAPRHESPHHSLSFEDQWHATVLTKLYSAGLTYTDVEEIVRQGPETMSHQKMRKVSKHCELTGVDSEDCLNMVNWLKFNQY